MFQGVGSVVGWVTIGVVVMLIVYLINLPKQQTLPRVGLAILIGGALGNLVDRISAGKVLDFIVTPLRPGIFNVADVMIHLGMILLVVGTLWWQRQENISNS